MSPRTGSCGSCPGWANQPAQGGNLLAQTLAPHPGASLSAYVNPHDGSQHVIYLDQHSRVIELQWSGTAVAVAQVAGGDADHKFPADDMPICSHVYPFDGNSQHAFALGLATVAAAALTIDYVIQLAAVQPSMLAGQTQDLSLVSMYNPHGIFLALEDLGYLLMAVSFLFAGLAIARRARFGSAIRWILIISGNVVAADTAHARWGILWLLLPVLLIARRMTCCAGAPRRSGPRP
jgi:hypothetical protein